MNVIGRKKVLHKALSVVLALAMILGNMVTGNVIVTEAAEEHTCTYDSGICTEDGCSQPYQAPNGDGTEASPYQIANAGQLYYFAAIVNGDATICTGEEGAPTQNTGAWAQLKADIVLNEGTVDDVNDSLASWTPVGSVINPYGGTFDGQGYTISGVYLNRTSGNYVGLFASCSGTVKNLGIVNSYISGAESTGSVAGYAPGATVENCYSTARVVGTSSNAYYIGGLIGWANGNSTVKNSHFAGICKVPIISVESGLGGGIVGYEYDSETDEYSFSGNCENCYYVSGNGVNVDFDGVKVRTSEQFASGQVAYELNGDRTNIVWGQTLSGEAVSPEAVEAVPVLGGKQVCIKGTAMCPGSDVEVEGYINGISHDITYTWSDHEYSGITCKHCGYVKAVKPEGEGTKSSPYRIKTAAELYYFAAIVNGDEAVCTGQEGAPQKNTGAWARLTEDIVLNEGVVNGVNDNLASWIPIGNSSNKYSGTFDGQNHTISGLYINSTESWQGLFGQTKGTIRNLGIVNSYIAGSWGTGSIAGSNSNGTISNCYSTSVIEGNSSSYIGGLAGTAGTFENSYFAGSCTHASGPDGKGGGIVGFSYNSDNDSYTTYGTIVNCYFVTGNAVSGNVEAAKARTLEQFASGQVAYELNGDQTEIVWGQTLREEDVSGEAVSGNEESSQTVQAFPVLGGSQVYQKMLKPCPGVEDTHEVVIRYDVYTNDGSEVYSYEYEDHDFDTDNDGKQDSYRCEYCSYYIEHDCVYEEGFCEYCDAYEKPEGEGTSSEPYELANVGNLLWYAEMMNDAYDNDELDEAYPANAVLTKDIYLNPEGVTEDSVDVRQWNMIKNYPDENVFDGQGHTIYGLCYNGSDDFAFIKYNYGEIRDITFAGVSIESDGEWAQVAAVCVENYETIDGVTVLGQIDVSYSDEAAGVSAENYDTIKNCINYANINGYEDAAGICGYNDEGIIKNCINKGEIAGDYWNGGICGYDGEGSITNCANYGNVCAQSDETGGICGCVENTSIKKCANYGNVYAENYEAGGICGYIYKECDIIQCYNVGNVTAGDEEAGGIVGDVYGDCTLRYCYNVGQISGGSCCGIHEAGGIIGDASDADNVIIENCYYLEGSADTAMGIAVDDCEDYEDMLASYVEWDGIREVAEADFADGAFTWNLNDAAGETVFYQTLTGEALQAFPEFHGEKVARSAVFDCKGQTTPLEATYFNGEKDINIYLFPNHNYDKETHVCKYCLKTNDKHVCTYDGDGICTSCKEIKLPEGTGSESDPYQIATAAQLRWFAGIVNGDDTICKNGIKQNQKACAVLVEDIVLNEVSVEAVGSIMENMMDEVIPAQVTGAAVWTPIGTYEMPDYTDMWEYMEFLMFGMRSMGYNGTFDGQGHSISGVYIYETNVLEEESSGLFGFVGMSGTVKNLKVTNRR